MTNQFINQSDFDSFRQTPLLLIVAHSPTLQNPIDLPVKVWEYHWRFLLDQAWATSSLVSISSTFHARLARLLHQYFWAKKFQSQNLTREKLRKHFRTKILYIKCWWNWRLRAISGPQSTLILPASFIWFLFDHQKSRKNQDQDQIRYLENFNPYFFGLTKLALDQGYLTGPRSCLQVALDLCWKMKSK